MNIIDWIKKKKLKVGQSWKSGSSSHMKLTNSAHLNLLQTANTHKSNNVKLCFKFLLLTAFPHTIIITSQWQQISRIHVPCCHKRTSSKWLSSSHLSLFVCLLGTIVFPLNFKNAMIMYCSCVWPYYGISKFIKDMYCNNNNIFMFNS